MLRLLQNSNACPKPEATAAATAAAALPPGPPRARAMISPTLRPPACKRTIGSGPIDEGMTPMCPGAGDAGIVEQSDRHRPEVGEDTDGGMALVGAGDGDAARGARG